MPSLKTCATVRLVAHLPDEKHGFFHFTILRKTGGTITPLEPTTCALLFPELTKYLPLHEADADGVPRAVVVNAQYHAAGVFFPGEAFADHCGQTEAGNRLRRLLRMDAQQYADLYEKLASCVAETQSARAMGAVLEEQINLQRIRWRREADEARAAITIAMQSLGTDATIEDEATA